MVLKARGAGEEVYMEFRGMRRNDKSLTFEECEELLKEGKYGCLSVNGDGGYPYGVFLNYGYVDGKIYFHSTSDIENSHKLSAIKNDDKVCFTVETRHELAPAELNTFFRSVCVFGRARILMDPDERWEAMQKMMIGLAPEFLEWAKMDCQKESPTLAMVEIVPEHMTGKYMAGDPNPAEHARVMAIMMEKNGGK